MTQTSEMKLLGTPGSVFVTRVKFVLKLKSIDYEYIEEDLWNKSELLLKTNPVFQRVPVLLHGNEQPMIESLAIMEYLDEIKPNVHPLLPSNPSERVQCRMVTYIFDTKLVTWIKEFMVTRNMEKREVLKKSIIGGTVMLEEVFVNMSKGKPFFGGDDLGYLDVAIGAFLGWIRLYEKVFDFRVFEEDRTPNLARWEQSMWSHEVTSLIPSHEAHVEFLKLLEAVMKNV